MNWKSENYVYLSKVCCKAFVLLLMLSTNLQMTAQQLLLSWDREVEVTTGIEEFNKVDHFAYSTLVYETSKSQIRSLVASEVEARSSQKSKSKKVVSGHQFRLPGHENDDIVVHAKADPATGQKDVIKVSVTFLHSDSVAVSPDSYPEADKSARELVHSLGVTLNRFVVADQIASAEKELESIKRNQQTVIKQKENLESSTVSYEQKISRMQSDSIKQEGAMTAAQAEVEAMDKLTASADDKKYQKKYKRAKDRAISAEQKYLKVGRDLAKTRSKLKAAQVEIPQKEKEIEAFDVKIEQQVEVIAALNKKYDDVH